jgi:hypothetical protein
MKISISQVENILSIIDPEAAASAEQKRVESAERKSAWERATELKKDAYGTHTLIGKQGRPSRDVVATGIKDDRGHRLVMIPYTTAEMARRRNEHRGHLQYVNPARLKRAS